MDETRDRSTKGLKVLCIDVFNRPELLRSTLASIPKGGAGWKVYLSLDKDTPQSVENICIEFERSGVPTKRWKQGHQMGCRLNTFNVCHIAMLDGAECILCMDDDITLSPDALKLCDWYLSKPELLDTKTCAGLALCRRFFNDPDRPNSITHDDHGHLGQGHCFTRQMWFDFIARSFWVYEPTYYGGADWSVAAEAVRTNRKVFRPRFARAKHSAAVGYHGPGIGIFPDQISDGKHTDYVLE